jgi:hypothetical protein
VPVAVGKLAEHSYHRRGHCWWVAAGVVAKNGSGPCSCLQINPFGLSLVEVVDCSSVAAIAGFEVH